MKFPDASFTFILSHSHFNKYVFPTLFSIILLSIKGAPKLYKPHAGRKAGKGGFETKDHLDSRALVGVLSVVLMRGAQDCGELSRRAGGRTRHWGGNGLMCGFLVATQT